MGGEVCAIRERKTSGGRDKDSSAHSRARGGNNEEEGEEVTEDHMANKMRTHVGDGGAKCE